MPSSQFVGLSSGVFGIVPPTPGLATVRNCERNTYAVPDLSRPVPDGLEDSGIVASTMMLLFNATYTCKHLEVDIVSIIQ